METNGIKWKQRFEHYKDALRSIETVVDDYEQFSELEKDGLIQRFEFTFDLAWKVMQDYIQYAGYTSIKGPRACITQMGQEGMLDVFVWGDILNARNELSHIYNEEKSRGYLDSIVKDYLPAFQLFSKQMDGKL